MGAQFSTRLISGIRCSLTMWRVRHTRIRVFDQDARRADQDGTLRLMAGAS
jgi:hypothetical protein